MQVHATGHADCLPGRPLPAHLCQVRLRGPARHQVQRHVRGAQAGHVRDLDAGQVLHRHDAGRAVLPVHHGGLHPGQVAEVAPAAGQSLSVAGQAAAERALPGSGHRATEPGPCSHTWQRSGAQRHSWPTHLNLSAFLPSLM
jgi:hypothetical protein